MWCPYVTKKFNYRKIILMITNFGGLNVLSPNSKLMYIKYITYSFSTTIRLHVCDSWMKHYQKKENWKNNAMAIYKSPPLWYGSGIFFKKDIIMYLMFKNVKNTLFWMKFHPKTSNLYMVLDLVHVYQYHTS